MIRLADNLEQQLVDLTATVAAGCPSTSFGVASSPNRGLLSERMIPLNDAARFFPRPGGREISKISLWRWATKGVRCHGLPPDKRLRLATVKAGLTRYTSIEAIERFIAAQSGGACGFGGEAIRPPRLRKAEAAVAAAQLKADGFM